MLQFIKKHCFFAVWAWIIRHLLKFFSRREKVEILEREFNATVTRNSRDKFLLFLIRNDVFSWFFFHPLRIFEKLEAELEVFSTSQDLIKNLNPNKRKLSVVPLSS